MAAASASPPNSNDRNSFLERVFREARDEADGALLGELAGTEKDPVIRSQLRIRQAELLADRKQSAQIVLDLIQSRRLPAERFFWGLNVLESADLSEDVVRLVEGKLRAGQPQPQEVKRVLRLAYARLGLEINARRAATDVVTAPAEQSTAPGPQRNNRTGGGQGFFSVP